MVIYHSRYFFNSLSKYLFDPKVVNHCIFDIFVSVLELGNEFA